MGVTEHLPLTPPPPPSLPSPPSLPVLIGNKKYAKFAARTVCYTHTSADRGHLNLDPDYTVLYWYCTVIIDMRIVSRQLPLMCRLCPI
jgi:hypothetical protein